MKNLYILSLSLLFLLIFLIFLLSFSPLPPNQTRDIARILAFIIGMITMLIIQVLPGVLNSRSQSLK